ncbi:MAG: NAD-dependent epimerase/dehydratase family protein [Proteobacteria bacterium]|nr:NAD-dependent epimerase/dehydratase family protein [Pseudomonadota bacterium]
MSQATILVTGGRGFIGSRLVSALKADGEQPTVMTRGLPADPSEHQADLSDVHAVTAACQGIHTIFHCAGHAHAFSARGAAAARHHWQVNFEGTCTLAEAAGRAGAKVFVFLSSVKAMGDPGDECVSEDWPYPPDTDYGRAKRAAESAILEIGNHYKMRIINLRPVMVFGGGRGNLERMVALVRRGLFPPLPETGNRRSFVHVDDLIAAMRLVAVDPRAAGRTYIVAHRAAVSGRDLYNAIRAAASLPAVAWTCPQALLQSLARLGDGVESIINRRVPLDSEALSRLLGSACYSPERIHEELGWRAEISLKKGLEILLRAKV